MNFTTEQIIALAPDASSAKSGRALADAAKWTMLGRSSGGRAVWGACAGSGREPYRTEIDTDEPAFRCTCPSRKFPCKHALGLLLLLAARDSLFKETTAPAHVAEWLAKRDEQAQRKKAAAIKVDVRAAVDDEAALAKREASRSKRVAGRHAKVAAGLAELELWLRDLVRQGLARAQGEPARYWEQMAARMIDAQAPSVARRLREMSGLPHSGEGWTDLLTSRLGTLYLLVEGFKRIETLDAGAQADIRTAIGWTQREEELLNGDGLSDDWCVLGQRITEEEGGLRVQRTWLRGLGSARSAVVLDFSHQGRAFSVNFLSGSSVAAELVFYPSNYPLRAALKQRTGAPRPLHEIKGYATCERMLDAYAEALARNPLLETFPAPLEAVVAVGRDAAGWFVADAQGRMLPLSPQFAQAWKLVALGGGRPFNIFGEWDGRQLLPLAALAEGRYATL